VKTRQVLLRKVNVVPLFEFSVCACISAFGCNVGESLQSESEFQSSLIRTSGSEDLTFEHGIGNKCPVLPYDKCSDVRMGS
jgi:hypothetical protein